MRLYARELDLILGTIPLGVMLIRVGVMLSSGGFQHPQLCEDLD